MAYVETRKNKNGDIVYRAQLQLDGRRLSATFERKRDARQWEAELRSRARNNKNFLSRFSDKTTVAEVIERYKCEAFRNKERLASDRGYQLDWWVEAIGNLLITEVDKRILSAQLEKLAHKRTNTGRTLSPATVNRYRAAFSVVLTKAWKDWDIIDSNPFEKIEYGRERSRVRFLEQQEIDRLRQACRQSRNGSLEAIFLIAICTGMRRGEILSLTRKDIRLSEGLICIEKTKNHSRRSVPISDALRPTIEDLMTTPRFDTPLLFPSTSDPLSPMCIKNAWSHAVKKAGIEDYTFHDNRHTAASVLAFQNVSDIKIATILGHKTLEMVKRYAHLKTEELRGTLNAMNKEVLR